MNAMRKPYSFNFFFLLAIPKQNTKNINQNILDDCYLSVFTCFCLVFLRWIFVLDFGVSYYPFLVRFDTKRMTYIAALCSAYVQTIVDLVEDCYEQLAALHLPRLRSFYSF